MCGVHGYPKGRTRRRHRADAFDDIDEAVRMDDDGEAQTPLPPEPLSGRSMMWVLSRPSVWINFALAAFFLFERGPFFLVAMFGIFGAVRIMSLLSTPGVEERVRLREEKSALGLNGKKLNENERQEILKIDEYRRHLVRAGGDPALADQVVAGAWEIVRKRRAGPGSAASELRRYRQELPPIDVDPLDEPDNEQSLKDKLEAELQILRATHRELNI